MPRNTEGHQISVFRRPIADTIIQADSRLPMQHKQTANRVIQYPLRKHADKKEEEIIQKLCTIINSKLNILCLFRYNFKTKKINMATKL